MISVIIPCFNYGHLIGETIEGIIRQTYSNFEVIIIDDGSMDNTEKVVRNYIAKDIRIKYFKYPNAGPSLARNRGLDKAIGEYIQFLDADDLLESRKFELELNIFNQNPHIDIVYGSVRYFHSNNPSERLYTYWGTNKEWMPKLTGNGSDILVQTLKGNFSHLSSVLFKRKLIDEVGVFDSSLRAAEDYHFLLRSVLKEAYFHYHDTPDTYSLVRWHSDNTSRDLTLMWTQEVAMRTSIKPLLSNLDQSLQVNNNAIKSLEYKINRNWKRYFLSGGKVDFLKKIVRIFGLEKILLKAFYR